MGVISAISAWSYARKNSVDWRSVVLFGIPGMIGAVLGAHGAQYMASWVQLLIFSGLLIIAASLMLKPVKLDAPAHRSRALWKIALDGLVVGVVTGLVGVGGGFLIIPALVILGGLSMTMAVGTSLVIIAMKSVSGFWEYLHVLARLDLTLDWKIIILFSILGIIGGQVGAKLHTKLPQQHLRRFFALFLIMMGGFILWQNLPKLLGATL